MPIDLILHEALSLALLYSCFCRAVHMDAHTRVPIRLAFWMLGATSVFCVFAPLVVAGFEVSLVSLALMASILTIQGATAYYWRSGVPKNFLKRGHRNRVR